MDVLREAGEPLGVLEITLRALAKNGAPPLGPRERRDHPTKVLATLVKLERRGVARKVGSGKGTRRGLVTV